MPRNGLKAVESKEPNELYDSLSQEAQDKWDLIGTMGYAPEKGLAGLWFARNQSDENAKPIGPAESLDMLRNLIEAEGIKEEDFSLTSEESEEQIDVDNPDMIELEEDGDGNPYLPGQRPQVIRKLAASIMAYDRVKLARCELTGQETAAKKKVQAMLKAFEPHLEVVKDSNGKVKEKFYKVGHVRGKISYEEKEVFGTDHNVETIDD